MLILNTLPRILFSILALLVCIAPTAAWAQTHTITFVNNSPDKVSYYFVNAGGGEQWYADVAPNGGQVSQGGTRAGHLWIVRNATGTEVARVTVSKNETVIIGSGGSGNSGLFRVVQTDPSGPVFLTQSSVPKTDDALLFVAQASTSPQNGAVETGAIGVAYIPTLGAAGGTWAIVNEDSYNTGNIGKGSQFNVLVAPANTAFVHKVAAGGGNVSYFNNALVNGDETVTILVTKRVVIGGPRKRTHPIAIHWDAITQRWGIAYADEAPLEAGAEFNVLAIKENEKQIAGNPVEVSDWMSPKDLVNPERNVWDLPGQPDDFLFTTFDAAPPGKALPGVVPNPNHPFLTRVGTPGKWRIQTSGGALMPENSRFILVTLQDKGGVAPPPPPGVFSATAVNNSNRPAVASVLLPGAANYDPLGSIPAGQTKTFPGLPNGAEVLVAAPGQTTVQETIAGSNVTLTVGGGGVPNPANPVYSLSVTNNTPNVAKVYTLLPPASAWTDRGNVAPGLTQLFAGNADGTRAYVSASGAPPVQGTFAGRNMNLTIQGGVNPVGPQTYTVTVTMKGSGARVFSEEPGAGATNQIGYVNDNSTLNFLRIPNGTRVVVRPDVGAVFDGTVRNANLVLSSGGAVPPPGPPAGGYHVTISVQSLEVANGGDGVNEPGELYWELGVDLHTSRGVETKTISERNRNGAIDVVSGRSYQFTALDRNGGTLDFDTEAGIDMDIWGEFDEADDFLRGDDDHMGDFEETVRIPNNKSPVLRTFKKRMLEGVAGGGDITLTFTVSLTPN